MATGQKHLPAKCLDVPLFHKLCYIFETLNFDVLAQGRILMKKQARVGEPERRAQHSLPRAS
jgi:hypothetical protein